MQFPRVFTGIDMALTLVIGNKTYSSWSLRAWLALRQTGAPFQEIRLALDTPEFARDIGRWSPSRRVPALQDDDVLVWESLAIGEYLAERFPAAQLWPADPSTRAYGRAISHEMHAGFPNLRNCLPFNARRQYRGFTVPTQAQADIARIGAIWREARQRYGAAGSWLLGGFSLADAMYAPVALRFHTYGVAVGAVEQAYIDTVLAHPPIQEWLAASRAETEVLPHEEQFDSTGEQVP